MFGSRFYKFLYLVGISVFISRRFTRLSSSSSAPPLVTVESVEKQQAERLHLHRKVCKKILAGTTGNSEYSKKELPLVYVARLGFSYCLISKTGTTSLLNALSSHIIPAKGDRERIQGPGGVQNAARSKLGKLKLIQSQFKCSPILKETIPILDTPCKTGRFWSRLSKRRSTLFLCVIPLKGLYPPTDSGTGNWTRRPGNVSLNWISKYAWSEKKCFRYNNISDGFHHSKYNSRFQAFIGYLLEYGTESDNLHFRPYWSRCNTCRLQLDFIGKSETMVQDRFYLKSKLEIKTRTLNTFAKVHIGAPTRKVASELFRTLTKSQMESLYALYREDFDLFGYSPEPYMSLALPDSSS